MTLETAIETVLASAKRWTDRGTLVQPDGTRCFGQLPQIGPLAWLYVIYPPLQPAGFSALEERLGRAVHGHYRPLLEYCNGLNLFADSLSLDGLVLELDRSSFTRQPYALVTPNVDERPDDADPAAFFIGGYGWDGSLLYLDDSGTVVRCSRESAAPLDTWPSLPEMLTAEVERLEHLVESSGGPDAVKEALPSHGRNPPADS
jgi:hypothetical protein